LCFILIYEVSRTERAKSLLVFTSCKSPINLITNQTPSIFTLSCDNMYKNNNFLQGKKNRKGKAIPLTGRGDSHGFETSKLSHFLDNRLTDGSEGVSLTRKPSLTLRKSPGTHFC
jgi:hypothetical protein